MVYSVTKLADTKGLCVVEAKSILAVVSIQPHSHKLNDGEKCCFVWEKLGLEMGIFSDDYGGEAL